MASEAQTENVPNEEEAEPEVDRKAITEGYLDEHDIRAFLLASLNEVMQKRPADVCGVLSQIMMRRAMPAVIDKLVGREVLDCRGHPTIEVDVFVVQRGISRLAGRASSASGLTLGPSDAKELRDVAPRYFQRGVQTGVKNVTTLSGSVAGLELGDLGELDRRLAEADGTELHEKMGGLATCAASMALAVAGAKIADRQLFEHVAAQFFGEDECPTKFRIPTPMFSMLDGGRHSGSELKVREFMIVPREDIPYPEQMRMAAETYHKLGEVLRRELGVGSTNVGDEGGYAPAIRSNEQALALIERAINISGYDLGKDIKIALDIGVVDTFNPQAKQFEVEPGVTKTGDDQIAYWAELLKRHPAVMAIEDAVDDKDADAWTKLRGALDEKVLVVGDALTATNSKLMTRAVEGGLCNGVVLKVNQTGTMSKTMEVAKMAFEGGQKVIVSHRSGDVGHSIIADLAVAIGAWGFKAGAPARGERTEKYTRLLQIYEMLRERDALLQ